VTVDARPSEQQLAALTGGGPDAFPMGDDDGDDATGSATPAGNTLGLAVQPLTPAIARAINVDSTAQGVVVAQVDPSSDAAGKLQRGDLVSAINGTPVRSAAELTAAVAAAKAAGRPQVLVLAQRGRGPARFLPIKIKG